MNLPHPPAPVLEALAPGPPPCSQIRDVTGLPSGTIYPLLRRLDREGLVSSRWEKPAVARREQRPPRRYYQLTAAGEAQHALALERFHAIEILIGAARKKLRPARSEA